jgi:hypothetical protein
MIAAALPIAHAIHISFGRISMLVAADSQHTRPATEGI